MPQSLSSCPSGTDRSLREIVRDIDDSSMRIFKMYKNKTYLPHSKRISNIAWRIQNKKIMLSRPHPISPPASGGSTTSANGEGFDYANHILHLLRQNSLLHSQSLNRSHSSSSTHSRQSSQGSSRIPPSTFKLLTSSPLHLTNKADQKNRTPTSTPYPFHLERSDLKTARDTAIRRSSLLTKRMPYSEPDISKPVLQCSHCFSESTPMWRQGPRGELLCNACGLYNKLHGSQRQPHANRLKDRQVQVNNTRLFMNAQNSPISAHATSRADYSSRAANDEIPDWENLLSSAGSNLGSSAPQQTLSAYSFQDPAPAKSELTTMDIDEIDNLLNMNLFHPESSAVHNHNLRIDNPLDPSHMHGTMHRFMDNAKRSESAGDMHSSLSFYNQSAPALVDNHFPVSSFNPQTFSRIDHQAQLPQSSPGIGQSSPHLNATQNFGSDTNMHSSNLEQPGSSLYSWLDFTDPSTNPR